MAAEKAATEQAAVKNAAVAAAERAAAERAAAEKAAAEKAAAEKSAQEKAAATEKAAAEKTAAERLAAEKGAAEKALERFVQRRGKDKVLNSEPTIVTGSISPAMMNYQPGSVLFVNDSSCGPGAIKEITIENPQRNSDRSYRCISLADDKPIAARPAASKPAAAAPAAATPTASSDGDAQLERFIQRKGRNR